MNDIERRDERDNPPREAAVTLGGQLFEQLTEAILQGELPAGSKINEASLAQKYGVSRGPLREALHRLQERKLVVRTANHSARVAEPTEEMLHAIFGVREALESMAARQAAEHMSEADILRLAEGVKNHEAQIAGLKEGRHNALGSADQDFHFRIAEASGNPILIELLCNQLYPLLRLYRSRGDNLSLRTRALLEHQRILSAIQDRDPEMAEMAMRRHIQSARKRRAEALGMGSKPLGLPEEGHVARLNKRKKQ